MFRRVKVALATLPMYQMQPFCLRTTMRSSSAIVYPCTRTIVNLGCPVSHRLMFNCVHMQALQDQERTEKALAKAQASQKKVIESEDAAKAAKERAEEISTSAKEGGSFLLSSPRIINVCSRRV
eukprot:TRINITY_DN7261_c0_g2_i1.p1 TRINITY_DN7261_c0_g2~~TRINITY_DN7261_c0_g2_i1.p1  ORF type:complete len:124 (-),score=18.71 TRINITY_DN7261_c0_g2_i1:592-963(-)